MLLGVVAGVGCAVAVSLKYKLRYDDSLDVVGVHFVGGWIGSLWIGLFGSSQISSLVADEGLFYGGGLTQLGKQALGSGVVTVMSFGIALVLGFLIDRTIGFRLDREAEAEGIDLVEHAESAYDYSGSLTGGIGSGRPVAAGPSVDSTPVPAGTGREQQ